MADILPQLALWAHGTPQTAPHGQERGRATGQAGDVQIASGFVDWGCRKRFEGRYRRAWSGAQIVDELQRGAGAGTI